MPRGRPRKKKEEEVSAEQPTHIPVEENKDFVRDTTTNAIINTNRNAYRARMAQKNRALKNALEIQSLKDEIAEIKQLLKDIASK